MLFIIGVIEKKKLSITINVNRIDAILLAFDSYFKLNNGYNHFKSMKIKFNALNHWIESDKNTEINDHSYVINAYAIITSFDGILYDLVYRFPAHKKEKILKNLGMLDNFPIQLLLIVLLHLLLRQ